MTRTTVRVREDERCLLEGIEECSGQVMDSICEGHSRKLFQVAWR